MIKNILSIVYGFKLEEVQTSITSKFEKRFAACLSERSEARAAQTTGALTIRISIQPSTQLSTQLSTQHYIQLDA